MIERKIMDKEEHARQIERLLLSLLEMNIPEEVAEHLKANREKLYLDYDQTNINDQEIYRNKLSALLNVFIDKDTTQISESDLNFALQLFRNKF
jgi:hypothetical protein